MPVSIDTVYQRVLALANKEQRGYITPLEFNLLANQAQSEIFEQYFYDLNQFKRQPGDKSSSSDMEELIENKLTPFVTILPVTNGNTFPLNYRIGKVFLDGVVEIRKVKINEAQNLLRSRWHAKGSRFSPVYSDSTISGQDITVVGPTGITNIGVTCEVISEPNRVEWAYNVIGEKALYNATVSVDFQLHDSEETNLVLKILELAGVIIKQQDVVGIAGKEDIEKIQKQKA